MKELDQHYIDQLETIKKTIQASEELKTYQEEEEEEDYQNLRNTYEPQMATLHSTVAEDNPLQLINLEREFLHEDFEGLYLPRLLGFSVLREEINTTSEKYVRPQNHFKDILLAICNSSNFDYLKKRIGQSIQMGFAFSSDIWITNLINTIVNRRIRYFLQGQKLDKYRVPHERRRMINRFRKQFVKDNFLTTEFPSTVNELKLMYNSLKNFLVYRAVGKHNNASILPEIKKIVENKDLFGMKEHVNILGVYANMFDLDDAHNKALAEIINQVRKSEENFTEYYFDFLLDFSENGFYAGAAQDKRASELLDKSIDDDLTRFYNLVDDIHSKSYLNEEVIDDIRVFYHSYEGLSDINECLRNVIYGYFARLLNNLELNEYSEMFELAKIFPTYMDLFSNEQFNQDVKDLCMRYIRKLLKHYTDKRGRDYQDIKKFVSANFVDFGFLKEKEVVELFKTRRKRKTAVK